MKSNKPLVSVIIPVYKGERYIIKCLGSIARQDCHSVEVIIVDDESPDGSVALVREYAEKENIQINIISQKNQGQGAARNTGIDNVSGQYLMFADQDDTLEPGMLDKLLELAAESGADIVSCGYRRVAEDGTIKAKVRLKRTEWSKYRVPAPWAKLYRTEFITKNKIKFLPVTLGEDIYFMIEAYSHKPKVDFLPDIGYNWLWNIESVSNTDHKKIGDKTSLLPLFDRLESLEKKENLKNDRLYEYFLVKTAVWDILYTVRENPYKATLENSTRIWGWLGSHFQEYERNPYIRISKPKGESLTIRLIVWGYMMMKRLGFEKAFLWVFSKKG